MNINKLFRYISIRTKLTVAFLGITVIPLIFIGWYSSYLSAQALRERTLKQLDFQAKIKAREIESFLGDVKRDLIYLSESAKLKEFVNPSFHEKENMEMLGQRLEEEFLLFSQGKRAYYQIRFIDERGKEIVRINYESVKPYPVSKDQLQDKSDRYYFRKAMEHIPGQIYISSMDLNMEYGKVEIPHRPVVRYATPVLDNNGNKKGIIIINIFAKHLFDLIKKLPPESATFLIDREGFYLYYLCPKDGEKYNISHRRNISVDYPKEIVSQFLNGSSGATIDSKDAIISFAPISTGDKGNFWILAVSSPKRIITAPIKRFITFMALIMVGVIGIAGMIGVLSARHFSRPILALCDGTKSIASGNFAHRIVVETNDELEDLAVGFNNMAKKLGDSVKKLERWNEELQTEVERRTKELRESEGRAKLETRKLDDIVSSIGAGLSLINKDMKIVWANKTLALRHGGLEALIGRSCHETYWHRGEPCPDCLALETFKDGSSKGMVVVRGEDPETSSYYQIVTTPVKDEKGEVFQVLELSLDITESVMRERQARREVAQAEKLAALGQLSMGVIHEVANPLAAIKTSIQIMEKELAKHQMSSDYSEGIVKEIDDLVSFLRTFSSFAKPKKPDLRVCDISEVMERVFLLVNKDAERRGIRIIKEFQGVPKVKIDSVQIQQVFLNLILNAFDAIPSEGELRISVSPFTKTSSDGFIGVSFADNGFGIKKEDLHRIFDPFFTTKPKGTGLGLSIAYQIIRDHGGTIEVTSEVGKGSNFTIKLPVQRL